MPTNSQRSKEKVVKVRMEKETKETKPAKRDREAATPTATPTAASKMVKLDTRPDGALSDIAMDHSEQMDKAAANPSALAVEVMGLIPMILPLLIDRIIPTLIPRIMDNVMSEFEKKVTEKIEKNSDELFERYEQLRVSDNIRQALELDKLRQMQKQGTVRITGIPEGEDVSAFVKDIAARAEVDVKITELSSYRIGKKREPTPEMQRPAPRPAFVTFSDTAKKGALLRNKSKIKTELIDRKISVYEDITKARRALLATVRDKFRSGHTRGGDVAFFKENRLVFVRQPNDLFAHGFTVEEISKSERVLLGNE